MTKTQEAILTRLATESEQATKERAEAKQGIDNIYTCLYNKPDGVVLQLVRIETRLKDRAASVAVCLAVVAVVIAACDAIIPYLFG